MRDFLTGVVCIFIPCTLLYNVLMGNTWKAAATLMAWPIAVLLLVFLERKGHGPVPPR